jgi:anti-sigma regulatory factor (Ser/Thr protein kinase)
VRLCVSEAVTNAVVHAPAGGRVDTVVSVSAERGEDALVIIVTDNGDGFRHTTVSPGLGLGLPLIAALSSSMTISKCVDGGTEVSITFDL